MNGQDTLLFNMYAREIKVLLSREPEIIKGNMSDLIYMVSQMNILANEK